MSDESVKQMDKLTIGERDIILLRGEWSEEELQYLANISSERNLNNIMLVMPDEKSIETMPANEFYFLLHRVSELRGEGEDNIHKFSESGLLPLKISETGALSEELDEVIICDGISGGNQWENEMPKNLSLIRRLADGTEYRMRYVQEDDEKEETIFPVQDEVLGD